MTAGVPVIVIPHGLDTANTARTVAATGCGLSVAPVTVESITAALQRVLHDPTLAANARRMAEPHAPAQGVQHAISLIETIRPQTSLNL